MGCFKICFGTCKNQKVPTKQLLPSSYNDKRLVPLHPTKPVVQVSKSVIFEFNCRNKIDVLVDGDKKKKESEIYNLGNQKCTNLNEKDENVIGIDKFLDHTLSKLQETAGLEDQEKSTESRSIAKIGDLLQVSPDKKLNGLYNVRQVLKEISSDPLNSTSVGHANGLDDVDGLVQEESSDSLFSVSVGSKKKVNAAENDNDVREESSDSLFSVSVESKKQISGLDDVEQLVQEETSDSLFSVSVGSKKKLKTAENGDVLVPEESSDSLFSVSVESRQQYNGLDNVDQEESSDSLFSVSVGSDKKVNAAENGNLLVQEESLGLRFSALFESRKQVNAVETDENEVNSPISFGVKHICKHLNSSPAFANSVLGPIENLTNRKKGIKVTTDSSCVELKEHEKENMSPLQGLNLIPFSIEEPSLKRWNNRISKQQKGSHLKAGGSPVAVDTSLSSWLVKSDGRSSEDTPALSPRIGSAGSYRSHTENIKNSSGSNSSRGRISTNLIKDKIFNHRSTPFLERLESA